MKLLAVSTNARPSVSRWPLRIARTLAAILALTALVLLTGGLWLALLSGSPYYLLTGIAFLSSAAFLACGRERGVWILVAALVGTIFWAVGESGIEFWPLVPRLVFPALLTLPAVAILPWLSPSRTARWTGVFGSLLILGGLIATLALAFQPHGVVYAKSARAPDTADTALGPVDWTSYGGAEGTRHSGAGEITPANVKNLRPAWTFRSGDFGPGEDQNVPLQIGDLVYSCSRNNIVTALDADTGTVRWRFDPKASSPAWQRCRGLGSYASPAASAKGAKPLCTQRILQTTIDARLIALDAETGALCPGFGDKGVVALKAGMGDVKPGYYFQTSAPTVARGLVIIGGWVRDNQETGEPSGVIRAFDAVTGRLTWAWDLGNPASSTAPLPGQTYTRGTPNMWSHASFDDKLGLLYVPLGNPTPDYYGALRTPEAEKYGSSLVALDIMTGRERWHFQTVHHDLWDYDLGSQPALIDVPDGAGGTVQAVMQATKRGQLFLLDRRNGKPLADVTEKRVPQQGKAPGEWLAKTQPYSSGMPSVGTEPLSETRMWGMTMFDQLWCRIHFRQARYDGDFTPPGTTRSIQWPGNYGGFNWGSASYDPATGYAFLADIRLPSEVKLRSHDEVETIIKGLKTIGNRHGPARQLGTPYGVTIDPMVSPLGIPCNEPPFGTMTAIDMRTRTVAWQVPMGTVRDTGPFGIATKLSMPIGMPTIGGSLSTASGLLFFAGTQDFALRALDARTGRELWQAKLPVGSSATPMTYISPKSGKQYVLISAGGAGQSDVKGDYLIAYALP